MGLEEPESFSSFVDDVVDDPAVAALVGVVVCFVVIVVVLLLLEDRGTNPNPSDVVVDWSGNDGDDADADDDTMFSIGLMFRDPHLVVE